MEAIFRVPYLPSNFDAIVKADSFTGSVVGYSEKLPPVYDKLNLKVNLLDRVVGAKEDLKEKVFSTEEYGFVQTAGDEAVPKRK